jgi:TRAP-type mannitol/chloroaromatic compound transport system permease large subunit
VDALILIGSLFALIALGVPVAYALGLAALVGAAWVDIPFEAVMIKISDGVSKFSLLAIPFFVLAGAIMAEGGMARRLVAFANILVGFVRGGLSLVQLLRLHLRFLGCGYVLDRLGHDSADGEGRLSARFRDQCDDHGLGPGDSHPALP